MSVSFVVKYKESLDIKCMYKLVHEMNKLFTTTLSNKQQASITE